MSNLHFTVFKYEQVFLNGRESVVVHVHAHVEPRHPVLLVRERMLYVDARQSLSRGDSNTKVSISL